MKKPKKTWKLDETSKHFIALTLGEKKQDIIDFRRRWKLGDNGLEKTSYFPGWKEKIEKECQHLRREIRVSELEAYFEAPDTLLTRPVLSSEVEGRLREENWGDSLPAVFALEIRAVGSKLSFPTEWDRFLEYYLIHNTQRFDLIFNHGMMISIRYRINEEYGVIGENVCLTLGENTGSEDLDNFWKQKIKPYLLNLPTRIKGLKRKSKHSSLSEPIITKFVENKKLQNESKNRQIPGEHKERDRDITLSVMDEKNIDKLYRNISPEKEKKLNQKLGKIVQNIRYRHFKTYPE